MPRKKKFKLEDKLLLPGCDELIKGLKGYKEPALRPSTVAQILKWDFTPVWEYTDTEILAVFTRWLLKSPIFMDKNGKTFLRCRPGWHRIPKREITSPKVTLLLLFGLSGELANFFLSQKSEFKSYVKLLRKPLSIVEDLRNYKRKLISLGIVGNENKFNKVYVPIAEWMINLTMSSVEIMPSLKHKKEELVAALYPYFKNLTRLSDPSIRMFISHIMKHLGMEKGDVRKISERIRRRLERKGIKKELEKKDIDIERLKKTITYLTHIPL